jgi:hypothetical protein
MAAFAHARAGISTPRGAIVSSSAKLVGRAAERRDAAIVSRARDDLPSRSTHKAFLSVAASSLVLLSPCAVSAETLRSMTVAAGNAAFLEKEFVDFTYAGVKEVTPGLAKMTSDDPEPIECVSVTYDADKIAHETLMRTYWQHADPVNPNGSFKERGSRFRGAVWVSGDEERREVETNSRKLRDSGIFGTEPPDAAGNRKGKEFVNLALLNAPPVSFEPFPEERSRTLFANPKAFEKEAKARTQSFNASWGYVQFCAEKVCGYVRFAPKCRGECLDVFPQYRARNAGVPELEGNVKITGGSQ